MLSRTPSFLPASPPPFSLIRRVFRQISSKFSSSPFHAAPKINGMASECGDSAMPNEPVMSLADAFQDREEYIMIGSILVPLHCKNIKNQSRPFSTRCNPSRSDPFPSPPNTIISESRKYRRRTRVDLGSAQSGWGWKSSFSPSSQNSSLSHNETLPATNYSSRHDESPRRSHFEKMKAASAYWSHNRRNILNYADSVPKFKPYDICFHGNRNPALIGDTLHEKNRESCIELPEEGAKELILRPGMVLLKQYITHEEQVEIVKICRKLGRSPRGFYQPGYADGAKLRLQMMCLGLDWDPQTRKYGNKRLVDGSKPYSIPRSFSELVMRAIQEAHCLIQKECGVTYVEDILPSISPDICIVNFYNTNGRLGLHQDRDESRQSLRKGLPVVSFSIGDSAEFLYGDQRDVEKARNVLLESGDVLIFGGESRHVYHGVSSIIPDSAPTELLKDSLLSPGRLNLTFRQY